MKIHKRSFTLYFIIFLSSISFFMQGYDGEPPMLLKEEPEDGPRSIQKVPSLSDLSEESIGELNFVIFILFLAMIY